MSDPVGRLTEKQRECLRLVWRHHESKDIARQLSISPHSVDGRIKTAMRTLGVDDRFEAARILVHAEAGTSDQRLIYPPSDVPNPADHTARPSSFTRDERQCEHLALEEAQAPYRLASAPQVSWPVLPLPVEGRRENDLSRRHRLLWIAGIALGTTVAFGTLAAGLEALSRLG